MSTEQLIERVTQELEHHFNEVLAGRPSGRPHHRWAMVHGTMRFRMDEAGLADWDLETTEVVSPGEYGDILKFNFRVTPPS